MIISKSFRHGWYYWFRYDRDKLLGHAQPSYAHDLLDYFAAMDDCPHGLFCEGPRASSLRAPRRYVHRVRHPLTQFTACGKDLYLDRYRSSHSRVEMFLLENDIGTVAVEVPVWFDEDESLCAGFEAPLTGHIDVLRLTDKIEVWDYKPKAERERYAATQVYWYVLMLSRRLGLGPEDFRCGYFDEHVCYLVDM
ncbi:MAG: hypothetical protein PHW58_06235 [Candidatus Methanofastidiosa archaeon]|jgi:hypothetical protein|nr:hypothetical protein [Candidatus Methanofastidiosa archaeon]MDD4281806.1 hypothetical protein [Candidatus Methanofastidiosa archaeon]